MEKGLILKYPKKGIWLKSDNRRGIGVFPDIVKIVETIMLKRIKEHLEIFIHGG